MTRLRDTFLPSQPVPLALGVPILGLFIGAFYYSFWRFEDTFSYFSWVSTSFLLLLTAFGVMTLRRERSSPAETPPLKPSLVFAAIAVTLSVDFFLFSSWLAPVPWPLLAIAVIGGGYALGKWRSWDVAWRALAVVGVAYLALIVLAEPIHISNKHADMLPMVRMANESLLNGETPYLPRYEEVNSTKLIPFHMLPGLWLSYLPTIALDIDMRIVNVIALLGILALVFLPLKSNQDRRWHGLTVLPILFSPMIIPLIARGHIWPFWLATAACTVWLLRGRLVGIATLFGCLLATRQMALFIAGPAAIYFASRLKLSESIRYGLLAGVIFLGFILPFLVTSPHFLKGTYLGFEEKGLSVLLETGNPMNQVSFAGQLYHLGLYDLSRPIQFIIMFGFCALIIRDRSMDTSRLVRLTGLAYLFLIGFNPFVYPYHYVPGLLMLAIGFANPQGQHFTRDAQSTPNRHFTGFQNSENVEADPEPDLVGSGVAHSAEGRM